MTDWVNIRESDLGGLVSSEPHRSHLTL
jgi:hypothetical protein